MKEIKKIGLLTSGGDASGMNAAIRSVTRYAIYNKIKVIGFYEGYKGLINDNYEELNLNSVGGIIDRGGTILYSARSEKFKTKEGQDMAIANLKKHNIDGLVVIGGDGSFKGARDLDRQGVAVVGIPGTIDNDICGTDFTIGFDTALNVIIDLISKIRDTASSHDRLFVIEVMGRNSGILAVNAGLATGTDYILIPEVEVDLAKIALDIKNHREGKRHILIIVAEGAAKASEVASSVRLLAGHEVRVSVLGHIQRGGSPSAMDRNLASEFGREAVDALMQGKSGCAVTIKNMKVSTTPFDKILDKKKQVSKKLYELAHVLSK